MAELWDALMGFFGQHGKQTEEQQAANAISVIQGCKDLATLTALSSLLPGGLTTMPVVVAAIDTQHKTLDGQGTAGPYGDIAKGLYEGFAALAPAMGKAATDTLQSGLSGAAPSANALAGSIVDPLVAVVVQILEAGGQSVPPDVQTKLKSVLLPSLSMGLTLEIASNLAELIHPTKELGFGGISHFIHDVVGFQAMSEAYVYPIRKALIEIPTEKNIMHLTQPRHPPISMARDFTQKRMMTVEEYADDLRFDGIMEDAVQMAKDTVWRELSMRDMQRMFDAGRPDSAWIQKKVIRMGFRDEDVDKIVSSLNTRAVTAEIGSVKSLQRSQYKDGVLSREEYAAKLASRGITAEESVEFLDAVDAERKYDQNKDLQNGYELKFLNGRSTESELRAALGTLEIQPGEIDARIKYLSIKVMGKLKGVGDTKLLSRSDLEKQYAAGKITRDALIHALDVAGWSMGDAIAIADIADQGALDDVRSETIRAAEQSAKNLRIGKDELLEVYTSSGKRAEWAAARADYIEQLIIGKVKTTEETTV